MNCATACAQSRALAEAPQLENLVYLDVAANGLTDEAAALLRDRLGKRVVVKKSWER